MPTRAIKAIFYTRFHHEKGKHFAPVVKLIPKVHRVARSTPSPSRRYNTVNVTLCSASVTFSILIGDAIPHTYTAILRPPHHLLH